MIFSFDKSTSLEGGSEKNPEMIRGGFKKMKGKNKINYECSLITLQLLTLFTHSGLLLLPQAQI